jgi:hypothetical protein
MCKLYKLIQKIQSKTIYSKKSVNILENKQNCYQIVNRNKNQKPHLKLKR